MNKTVISVVEKLIENELQYENTIILLSNGERKKEWNKKYNYKDQ